jgi:hypothetical protein
MLNIGDKVRFKLRKSSGEPIEVEGIVHGVVSDNFGGDYLITEWQGIEPITVRKPKKV